MQKICQFDGCAKRHYGRGYCGMHYLRWRRYGDPSIRLKAAKGDLDDWLRKHVNYSADECLIWPFGKREDGRGSISSDEYHTAHRAMCALAHGDPPTEEHEAAHSCGNGHLGCVHPSHLRWATRIENLNEMDEHGTRARRAQHGRAKLNESDVTNIRYTCKEGDLSQRKIAEMFGVSQSSISLIANGKTWAV